MTVENFPMRGPIRFDALKAALRPVDTSTMNTAEVVMLCETAVPGCTVEEIIQALRQVAAEHMQEAEELRRYLLTRDAGEGLPCAVDGEPLPF